MFRVSSKTHCVWLLFFLVAELAALNLRFGDEKLEVKDVYALVEAGRMGEAFELTSHLHSKQPENFELRILYADFFRQLMTRPDLSVEILEAGFEYEGVTQDFCKAYFGLTDTFGYYHRAIRVGEPLFVETEDSAIKSIVGLGLASAYLHTRDYGKGIQLLENHNIEPADRAGVLEAKLMAAAGDRFGAAFVLKAVDIGIPDNWIFKAALVDLYRDGGEYFKAKPYVERLIKDRPDYCHWRIMEIDVLENLGDTDSSGELLDRYLDKYSEDPDALLILGRYAVEAKDYELADRISLLGLRFELRRAEFIIFQVESRLRTERYEEALELLESKDSVLTQKIQDAVFCDAMKMVALYGTSEAASASVYLQNAVESSILTPAMKRRIADLLDEIEQAKAAERLRLSADRA